jgi:hypothetical protein
MHLDNLENGLGNVMEMENGSCSAIQETINTACGSANNEFFLNANSI